MNPAFATRVARILGREPREARPLSGGQVGNLLLLQFDEGADVVAKCDDRAQSGLEIEGRSLQDLAEISALPVPEVYWREPTLLLMEQLPGQPWCGGLGERQAADYLADLHNLRHDQYGFEYPTVVGGLEQANPWSWSWSQFFAESRLRAFARAAHREGQLPGPSLGRIEVLAELLDDLIGDAAPPGLIHGDVWSGNVLSVSDRITGFIDPSPYYADPEIELAFITLFNTFGSEFFERYGEQRPIRPGFFEERAAIYNLYPLLVHLRLFGTGYLAPIEKILRQCRYDLDRS